MYPTEKLQIATPAFKATAYEIYARLRSSSPVMRVPWPRGQQAFLLTRYDDVSNLLKDDRFAKDRANVLSLDEPPRGSQWTPRFFSPLMRNLLSLDEPEHARLRKLVQYAFTPRRVELLKSRTQEFASQLLDRVDPHRGFDLISDFALPLPVTVICDLLGVPEPDRPKFARWSKTIINNSLTPLSVLRAIPSLIAFVMYLRKLIRQKRDRPQDDLITDLAQAEDGGRRLSDDELLGMAALLLTAGHETTTNLIGNGMLALMQHPSQYMRLQAEPALMETAVEELLRFASPVEVSTERYAIDSITIDSVNVPRGSVVLGAIASANRDERRFANADQLDLDRKPNRHLTFGQGGHFCVGAALARMEGRVALGALMERYPGLQLRRPEEALRWRPGAVLRGLEALYVVSRP